MSTRLVVGLGNPDRKYAGTRHNLGFRVADELARRLAVPLDREKFSSLVGEAHVGEHKVVLLKPLTYMNLSGQAVVAALKFYQAELSDVLVVCDDFNLDLEGAEDDIKRLAQQAAELDGVATRLDAGHTLVVRVADSRSRADALADVLKLADSNNLSLQSIHSGRNETENAYLQLLQEDEAHGFHRFEFDTDDADDALCGDSPA